MGLKSYSIRLDEKEYEKLKDLLGGYGEPDLNVGYVLRAYISDLVRTLPHLKKSDYNIKNQLSYWGTMFKQIVRTAEIENIMEGAPIVDRIIKEFKKDKKK